MQPAIVFSHMGLTVHAEPQGELWRGELLDEQGVVKDSFFYTREVFPGAVIGALCFGALGFATSLSARMWLHTAPHEHHGCSHEPDASERSGAAITRALSPASEMSF